MILDLPGTCSRYVKQADPCSVCGRALTYEQLPEDPQGRKPVCDGIDPGVLPPGPGEKYCGAGQGYPGVIVFNDKYFTIESVFEPCPNRQATTPSEIGRASSDTTTSTASEQPQQPSAPASNPEVSVQLSHVAQQRPWSVHGAALRMGPRSVSEGGKMDCITDTG